MTSVADRLHLNDAQRQALLKVGDGPLRVVAGPGTGKTTTVVAMYLHLLEEAGVRPGEILLLTFAANAADQLTSRIDDHVVGSYDESWVSTFHSFATRVLTRWGPTHGIAPFTLMNGFQEKLLMRSVLGGMPASDLGGLAPLRHSEALVQDALWFIGTLKQNLVRSDVFAELVTGSGQARLVDLAAVYRAYWRAQDAARLWDFRDVIAQCHDLLVDNGELRSELSSKFTHVIVDEYQDVDSAQVNLLRQLVAGHTPSPRLTVVGDPNQSIYGFRGTLATHLDHAWTFGGDVVHLGQSYRSYAQVLDAADALLSRWDRQPPRVTATRGRAAVDVVSVDRERTASDEAASVARQVRELLDSGAYAPSEIAVILRSARRSGRLLEEALRSAGVPVAGGGSPSFATSEVVRFCVSALRALAHPATDEHLVRVLESPFVGVPPMDSRRLVAEAERRRGVGGDALASRSLLTVLTHTCFLLADADGARWPLPWDSGSASPLAAESVRELEQQEAGANRSADREAAPHAPRRQPGEFFAALTDGGRDAIHRVTWRWARLVGLGGRVAPHTLLGRLVDELGVLSAVLDPSLSEQRRAEIAGPLRLMERALVDLDDFVSRVQERPAHLGDVVSMLDQVLPEYVDELDGPAQDEPGVRLVTVHASKGLEFPVVFIPALVAQQFPVVARARTPLLELADQEWLQASLAGFAPPWPETESAFLAEEARLGYVAATRARDVLRLSWAEEYDKGEPASPSVFLEALTSGGCVERRYLELHRVPITTGSDDAVDVDPGTQDWRPWSQPVQWVPGTTDSASSVARFLACPRKYFYGKAIGLPSETGPAARRGRAFHRVMERFHAPVMEARWRGTPSEARRIYDEICAEEIAAHVAAVPGGLRQRAEERGLGTLLDNYFASESTHWSSSHTVACEAEFQWSPLDDVTMVGFIDRILRHDADGTVEIVDYKTGGSRSPGTVRAMLGMDDATATDFQLLIYWGAARAGVVEGIDPSRVEVVGLWYPRSMMKRPPGIAKVRVVSGEDVIARLPADSARSRCIVLDREEAAARSAALVATLEQLREGRFEPVPRHTDYTCVSAWGTGCEYRWVCPGRIEEPAEYVPE